MMKGAIQVSIGFLIVMVISALVMIFMFGWLGSIFPQLTEISEYATAQAQEQMMNKFAEGGDTVLATIPTQQTFAPGSLVRFKLGIRKTAAVDDSEYFTLCVGKMAATNCVTPGDTPSPAPTDQTGIKFQFPGVTKIEERGQISLMSGVMEIPSTVPTGTHGFRIYVCDNPGLSDPPTSDCSGLKGSYGQYDFIVEVV
ncbi:MAG: hypothetical protein JSV63_04405 [Candidatus Aenigmatarchaeota archaeon]|nr:MAG: hypothetical protein JSV63_04405 [Candidatus Aenigmarchaeota archaeon]